MKFERSFYIPNNATRVDPAEYGGEVEGFEAYKYEQMGKIFALVFIGKAAKPFWHFRFTSEAARAKRIFDAADAQRSAIFEKQKRKLDKKTFEHSVKVGDVFGTNWGYEQTNREFFQVVEVKGKSVIIREIAQTNKFDTDPGYGPLAGKVSYIKDKFIGEPQRKLVLEGNQIKFASYRWGSLVTEAQNAAGFYVSWGH